MNKVIKILIVFLLSFWLWGVDWSQRNIDPETTKFLISTQFALALRYIFLFFIISYSIGKFKNYKYHYLFTSFAGILTTLFLLTSISLELNTILNFLISSTIFIFLPSESFSFLDRISLKTINILLLGGLLFLILFEFSSLSNQETTTSYFTTVVPDLSGFTTVNYKRFFGFFGGPIVLSTISAITFIYAGNQKIFKLNFKFFTLVICVISISLSNSVSGLIFLILYYSLKFIFYFFKSYSFRLPKLTLKNIILFFLFISFLIILYVTQSKAIDLFIGKISYIFLIISGNTSSASDLLNYDQFLRSSGSFLGRLLDISYVLSDMSLSTYLFGGLFDLDRGKILSESGIITLISIYGIPFTLLFLFITLRNFGIKVFIVLLLFNIPYNIFLMHPVYLLACISLKKEKLNYIS
tara:strand:- start:2181 stop:3413 length:1233 start_codon:yes stop_codon:yes gene_type:complete